MATAAGMAGSSREPQVYGEPKPGGSITQGRLLNALGIDPHIDLTALDIDLRLYSYLYSWKPFGEEAIYNNFAEQVEMPAPDGTEFIFTLRKGVKIQSQSDNPAAGEELNSLDVRESFVRRGTAITAPDKRFPLKISGTTAPNADALRAALQDARSVHFLVHDEQAIHPGASRDVEPDVGDRSRQSDRKVWRLPGRRTRSKGVG